MATTKATELGQLGSKLTIHNEDITLDGNVHGQYAGFDSDFTVSITAADTGDLSEGTNLYYTDTRADARAQLKIDALVAAAPGSLDTLNELAAALGDDANFSTTITNSVAAKLPLAGGTMTGGLTVQSSTGQLRLQGTSNTNKNVSIFYNESGDYGQINVDESGVNQKDLWVTGLNLKFGRSTSSESMRIDSSGRVGIGTSSPDSRLQVSHGTTAGGSNQAGTRIGRNTSQYWDFSGDAAQNILTSIGKEAVFGTYDSNHLTFKTNNTERMRIESGGALKVNSNDIKSSISGTYYLSGANGTAGSPTYVTYSFVDDPNTGMYRAAADTLTFATAGSERMRINSSGNVGIGTIPESTIKVDVVSSTNTRPMRLRFFDDNNGSTNNPLAFEYKAGLEIENAYSGAAPSTNGTKIAKLQLTTVTSSGYGATGSMFVTTNAGTGYNSGELVFSVGSNSSGLETEAMRINKDGNIGIGTNGPGAKLSVSGPAALANLGGGSTGSAALYVNSTSGHIGELIQILKNGATKMHMANDGKLGIGTSTNISSPLTVQSGGGADSISIIGRANGIQDESLISFYENDGTTRNVYLLKERGDFVIATGEGGSPSEGMRVTEHRTVKTPVNITQGGTNGNSVAEPSAGYLGSSGANFGTHAIFRTPTIVSSASAAATSQFLTIYSSGHWGEYPVFKFRVYGTYYTGGYREYVGQIAYSTASFTEVHNTSSSSFIGGGGGNTITMSNAIQVTDHAGQPRHKREFTLTAYATYGRCYVVVEIAYGGNRYYSSSTSASTLDALGSSGGSYHFKTIPVASGGGIMST